MSLFRKTPAVPPSSLFPPERYEPVLRSSICTGEKTACMRDRESGKLHEVMLIRDPDDLILFGKQYSVNIEKLRTLY